MLNLLTKIFGTANERALKKLWPQVKRINEIYEKLRNDTKLRNELEERAKLVVARYSGETQEEAGDFWMTEEFVKRIADGENPDEKILYEAYALVKLACEILCGKKWKVTGHFWDWNMIPYDVQLLGAIVLHQGKIAEMATGEGKTLVATMPLYLNAVIHRARGLKGEKDFMVDGKPRGSCHLVTVNDYLARRDKEWMGPVYELLGLTVGVIQMGMGPEDRKPQYNCDITYGTNNEFGFDYLRDNMVLRLEDKVQRGHHYAIVDEVDSILIDEARTPLIISGPVESVLNKTYQKLNPRVRRVVALQRDLINKIVAEAERLLKEGKEKEAGKKLLIAKRGMPKHKRLMKLEQEARIKRLIEEVEAEYMREKKLHELDEQLYFAIDEKAHTVNISEMGRKELAHGDPEFFKLPDLATELKKVDKDPNLSPREKFFEKQRIQREYAEKAERAHAITQLIKAYTLFERDVEYVVQNGKVIIVDEFTGRLMPGRRYSDGLHQALEAKEGVKIEEETQTLATITLQNYFRMYEKLAGMTGTAHTEAEEFWTIYKLEVVQIPTHKPVRRVWFDDKVYKTKREKYRAIMKEIEEVHKTGRPILIGTTSVEVSEMLSRMLKRRGIKHEVLNAKHHQREAEIVALAGQKGKVTIATNMAGRGTDIKLGPGVVKCKQCCINCEFEKTVGCDNCPDEEKRKNKEWRNQCKKECREKPKCGLHIIGSERHEARRIDLQLAGRCARQGDPGSVRFYVSLEDDLMRLFGGDRMIPIMERFGMKDDQPIEHKWVTKSIENAQKRVEKFHFGIRKHLLEYDDVLNKQRETIYKMRDQILAEDNLKERVKEMIEEALEEIFDKHLSSKDPDEWNIEGMLSEIRDVFLVDIVVPKEKLLEKKRDEIERTIKETIFALYKQREEELGEENMRELEKQVLLFTLDRKWREHLYELDALREGIGLRGYAQRDPLVEYKHEAFAMFEELLSQINRETIRHLFGLRFIMPEEEKKRPMVAYKPEVQRLSDLTPEALGVKPAEPQRPQPVGTTSEPYRRPHKKVGRNDPCPCGSGKKYKHCCGRFER